ncbi:S1 family peptidase [Saccharopolyspora griseoalba]|uniref:S1 family peptidase n=1 Tax=Saccharopolyspora griseoalba TaxID=1431848 RepID=A0ABW2LI69_9PSEU
MAHTRGRIRAAAGVLAAAALTTAMFATGANAAERDVAGSAAPPIVGGEPAQIEQSPWVVFLTDPMGNQFCGGTIGAANKIVTAAHCVEGTNPMELRVVAGREDKTTSEGTVAAATDVWVHPDYQSATSGADVAVVTLDRELPQPPLPLATTADTAAYQPGREAEVFGWGATSEGGESSDVLQRAVVPVTSDADCSSAYGEYDPAAMVCAGYPEGGVDSCQGDSGGPLVADGKLIGIVSTGNGCARPGYPGIYTRVSSYESEVRAQLAAQR